VKDSSSFEQRSLDSLPGCFLGRSVALSSDTWKWSLLLYHAANYKPHLIINCSFDGNVTTFVVKSHMGDRNLHVRNTGAL